MSSSVFDRTEKGIPDHTHRAAAGGRGARATATTGQRPGTKHLTELHGVGSQGLECSTVRYFGMMVQVKATSRSLSEGEILCGFSSRGELFEDGGRMLVWGMLLCMVWKLLDVVLLMFTIRFSIWKSCCFGSLILPSSRCSQFPSSHHPRARPLRPLGLLAPDNGCFKVAPPVALVFRFQVMRTCVPVLFLIPPDESGSLGLVLIHVVPAPRLAKLPGGGLKTRLNSPSDARFSESGVGFLGCHGGRQNFFTFGSKHPSTSTISTSLTYFFPNLRFGWLPEAGNSPARVRSRPSLAII